ncbi:hypothetical protein ABN028_26960 [Actinopolymorpha sp. B17G11]|uniref:hypothetical protein n=1 Tax=Actinopolymorpha sp. B17G11 TaxID=3160861 RepID=UPI0032E49C1F
MARFGSRGRQWRRLASPIGFALVLVCFSFPFVTVSCEAETGVMTADYTGWDFVIGGKPHITTGKPGEAGSDPPRLPPDQPSPDENAEPVAIQALALLTVLVVAGGVALVARPRVSPLVRGVVACVAVVLLIANQAVAQDHLIAKLRDSDVPADVADGLVDTRYGFSLALSLLLAVAGYNVVEMRLERRAAPRTPPQEDTRPLPPENWSPSPDR